MPTLPDPVSSLVRRPLLLVTVALVALAALGILSTTWGRPERRSLPPPSPTQDTVAPETSTSRVDRSRLLLQPVRGETTTTLVEQGRAVLSGAVVGPDGNVPDAVVRIERLVGDAVQVREARTGADGTFRIEGHPGGRLRVRAFRSPALTMTDPEIFFLADGEERELRLVLTRHEGPDVRASTAPQAPEVGDMVNLLVWVAERVVDEEGLARTVPRGGVPVEVRSSGWTAVASRPVTDAGGVALFTFRCDRAGSVTATAVVSFGAEPRSYPLEVPVCAARAPTTTTTDPDDTTTTGRDRDTTSTTRDD